MISSGNPEPTPVASTTREPVQEYRSRYASTRRREQSEEERPSKWMKVWSFTLMLVTVVCFSIVRSVMRVQDLEWGDVLLVRSVILLPLVFCVLKCRGISVMPEDMKGTVMCA